MQTLSQEVQKLISQHRKYEEEYRPHADDDAEKIHVDEIASKVATFYDRARNLIQYHEAHLLRKDTIERILNRRILLRTSEGKFAEAFIKELIRSGHLPNDSVPEKKIADVQIILGNLIYFLDNGDFVNQNDEHGMSDWLIRIFVPALEESLFPPPQNRFVGEMMYQIVRDRLVLKNNVIDESAASTQLFIATQRALFRFDDDQLQYMLLNFLHPQWGKLPEHELEKIVPTLGSLKANTEGVMKNSLGPYFLKLCRKEKIAFQLVGDLVSSDVPLDKDFEPSLLSLYKDRAEKISEQLKKLAFFSVVSFFISKIVVAIAIEIPLDRAFSWPFSTTNTIINILFPPLLMLVILAFVRPPSRKNFALVVQEVKNILSPENQRKYALPSRAKISRGSEFVVHAAYIVVLMVIFYAITTFLYSMHFSPFSIAIFILFTSMVIATSVKINNRAKEMSLEKEKATAFGFLADLVLIPFTALGRWVIAGLLKFNILVVMFDFLIELPLGLFLEFLENFRKFVNARKEEIQ